MEEDRDACGAASTSAHNANRIRRHDWRIICSPFTVRQRLTRWIVNPQGGKAPRASGGAGDVAGFPRLPISAQVPQCCTRAAAVEDFAGLRPHQLRIAYGLEG